MQAKLNQNVNQAVTIFQFQTFKNINFCSDPYDQHCFIEFTVTAAIELSSKLGNAFLKVQNFANF